MFIKFKRHCYGTKRTSTGSRRPLNGEFWTTSACGWTRFLNCIFIPDVNSSESDLEPWVHEVKITFMILPQCRPPSLSHWAYSDVYQKLHTICQWITCGSKGGPSHLFRKTVWRFAEMKNTAILLLTFLTQLILIKLFFRKSTSFCGNRVKNVYYLKTLCKLNFNYGNY